MACLAMVELSQNYSEGYIKIEVISKKYKLKKYLYLYEIRDFIAEKLERTTLADML